MKWLTLLTALCWGVAKATDTATETGAAKRALSVSEHAHDGRRTRRPSR